MFIPLSIGFLYIPGTAGIQPSPVGPDTNPSLQNAILDRVFPAKWWYFLG